MPCKIGADAWFDHHEARRYEVEEQTHRIADDEILSFDLICDPEMLEERGREAHALRPQTIAAYPAGWGIGDGPLAALARSRLEPRQRQAYVRNSVPGIDQ